MTNQITVISIEGNIGSGKSTLLEHLRQYYKDNTQVIFLKEPVDEWVKIQDEKGTTILEKFYEDQYKYSFSFQMMAYVSRLKIFRETLKKNMDKEKLIIITERSLYTDKMVFAQMLYDSEKMEHINHQIYLNWFDTFSQDFPVHKIVYVKTYPEICHFRIIMRSRNGEQNISLEYLENCSNYHDNMLNKDSNECICRDQLILDGNKDIRQDKNILKEWIHQIDTFINT